MIARMGRGVRIAAAVGALLAFAGACSGDGGGDSAGMTAQEEPAEEERVRAGHRADDSAGVAASAASLPTVGLEIIKTAELEVGVPRAELDDAFSKAIALAGRYGGFVLSTTRDAVDETSASVTLRVPSERFEAALTDLQALGDVRSESVTGEDVSHEFIDLQARLRNWRAQEAVVLRLFDQADSIEETFEVQDELSSIQLEIERIRGRLRYLADQTSFSTITARFTTVAAPPSEPGRFARAWATAVDILEGLVAAAIVSLGFVLPFTLLFGVGYVVFRLLRPRLRGGEI